MTEEGTGEESDKRKGGGGNRIVLFNWFKGSMSQDFFALIFFEKAFVQSLIV